MEKSSAGRCRKVFAKLARQADQLQALAAEPDARLFFRAGSVSTWSVADHLAHLAKANRAMADAIRKALASDDARGGGRPTFVGRLVLLTGWIPRGAGKAPQYTEPQAHSSEDLRHELGESQRALEGLEAQLPSIEESALRSNHFAFGDLTPFQWLKVIEIHTRHHLKIIGDLQQTAGSPWTSSE